MPDDNRSGGPRTSAGKAIAAMNAVRHGLRAGTPVIPGLEALQARRVGRAAPLARFDVSGLPNN